MSETRQDLPDRLWELLADSAMVGLTAGETDELDGFADSGLEGLLEEAELAAAWGHEALITDLELEEMPAALAGRIQLNAPFSMPAAPAAEARESLDRGWWPWLVAAASVLILVGSLAFRDEPGREEAPSLETALATFERDNRDLLRGDWRTVAEGYPAVSGRVVWSSNQQSGYMVLDGLPRNDPGRSQYQLWIVDPGRDQEPVDGGVFDVGSDGRVIVPIDAKLRVSDPKAFVITAEQPGGVVVSEGPHLVLAAI